MSVSLDSTVLDQLNSTQARALHDLTDKLTSCGVGEHVKIPQIIVVGEQSAGKSSVLEAISHVRFPVHGDLCTRFATELVLRQRKTPRVDVSVRFADGAKPSKAFHRAGFLEDDLPGIIEEAKACMGLTATGKGFSKDVLKLEIEGPSMYPLTLVDLPGLFSNDTASQSMKGKETVDQLVESYMKQEKSIILVVVPAVGQISSHLALAEVKKHDPRHERTLGVITKPDIPKPGYSDERNHIQLARNQESAHKLKLGWHVLRNRAEDEDSLETRDATEADFFLTSPWATISREDLGVTNLRKKLSKVLFNHIRNNLDDVIRDIETQLSERQKDLGKLGSSRTTPQKMRSFLLSIAADFQRLVRDGIQGSYDDSFFGELGNAEHKLRAQLRNFNRALDHVLATKGSKLDIEPRNASERSVPQVPEFLRSFLDEYPYDFAAPTPISRTSLHADLEQRAAANQGRELPGSYNTDLVIQLFRSQASPWKQIASFHIKQVTLVAKAFVDNLFRYIVGQGDGSPTTEALLCGCVDPFFAEKEVFLIQKLDELLKPYTRGYAMPQDAEFRQMVKRRTTDRLAEQLSALYEAQEAQAGNTTSSKPMWILLSDAAATLESCDGGEFATERVVDMMEAYYEMSRRTFTDNVTNLAIESCLISALPNILTPTQVDEMDNEQLEELAAEPEEAKSDRERLQREIMVLRQGLEQCRKSKPRGITVAHLATSKSASAVATSLATKASLPLVTTPPRSATPSDGEGEEGAQQSGGRRGTSPNRDAPTPSLTPSPTPTPRAARAAVPLAATKPVPQAGSGAIPKRASTPVAMGASLTSPKASPASASIATPMVLLQAASTPVPVAVPAVLKAIPASVLAPAASALKPGLFSFRPSDNEGFPTNSTAVTPSKATGDAAPNIFQKYL